MCTEQLPPGGYPVAVKYISSSSSSSSSFKELQLSYI